MNPALSRGAKKAIRTVIQITAGGGLTALVDVIAGGMQPNTKLLVLTAWTVVITFAQNTLETAHVIPTLLPTTGEPR